MMEEKNEKFDIDYILQNISKLTVLLPLIYSALRCGLPKGQDLPFTEDEFLDYVNDEKESFLVDAITDFGKSVNMYKGWQEIEDEMLEKLDLPDTPKKKPKSKASAK